jgi:hypothetical protein
MKSPILGGSYVARSTNAADARLVNLYAEATPEGGKEAAFLTRCPGLRLLGTVGSGPIRGMWTFGAYFYVVSGLELYRVSANYGNSLLGAVTGTGPVSMSDNGTQLFVACNGPGFIYSSSTGVFAAINDPDFAGAVSVGFIDGYFVFTQPDSQVFWVTTLYGTGIDPLDFASAEGSPDGLVSMIVDHREVWLFGTNSVEVWYDAGNTDFPLARIQGAFNEIGCAATYSVAKLDNGIFWLGSDARGNGIVYRSQGYTGVRVSTNAVEFAIQNYAVISDAVAYTYQQEGHTFYVLTFPSADATWVYDASTDLWHERAGWGPNGFMRHRSNCQVNFNNEVIVGDYENSNIYALDLNEYTDNGEIQKWLRSWRAIPPGQNNLKRTAQHSLQLDMEVGAFNTLTEQVPTNETAELAITLDGISVDMTAQGGGDILYAPFNSTTTTTDVISPAITPTVSIPYGSSLTFDATKGTFTNATGAYPTVQYGAQGSATSTKLSPANYPAESVVLTGYIDLTNVPLGGSSASDGTKVLRMAFAPNSSGYSYAFWGMYVDTGVLYSYIQSPVNALAGLLTTIMPGPSAGVHKYSIEWRPDDTIIFRIDSVVYRVTYGATRPSVGTWGMELGIDVTGYRYPATGGVNQLTLKDFLYQHLPPTTPYCWTNVADTTGVFSNNSRTFTIGGAVATRTSDALSGKVYCEFSWTGPSPILYMAFGVTNSPVDIFYNRGNSMFSRGDTSSCCGLPNAGYTVSGVVTTDTSYSFARGDRIGIAFDTTTQKVWFSKNGVFLSGDPAAGTLPTSTMAGSGPFYFVTSNYSSGTPAGTYTITMYPNSATMSYSPPSGFTRYDPS